MPNGHDVKQQNGSSSDSISEFHSIAISAFVQCSMLTINISLALQYSLPLCIFSCFAAFNVCVHLVVWRQVMVG